MDKHSSDPSLDEVVDPRVAVLIVWAIFFFIFIVLPSLCVRCLGCCGGNNRYPHGIMGPDPAYGDDGFPAHWGEEGSGTGGWDRYAFLTSAKRREVDESRGEMVKRCLDRVSLRLEGEHMLRLGEGSVMDGETAGDDGCVDAESAAERRGSLGTNTMASPDDYIHSDDDDEGAPKWPSPSLASPDDYIDRIDRDGPTTTTTAATDGEEPPKEKENEPPYDRAMQNLMTASDHSLVSLSEYTHVRIPYPGYYEDGTRVEERKAKVDDGDAANGGSCNWRLLFLKKRIQQIADENHPTTTTAEDCEKCEEGRAEEGDSENDDPKSVVRNVEERRNVPAFCAICLGEYSPSEIVSWSSSPHCTHVFHEECIVQWLVTLGKRSGKYHAHRPPDDGTEAEEGMEMLNYDLECPCCRQEFVDKANVLLGEKKEAATGADADAADAGGDENV